MDSAFINELRGALTAAIPSVVGEEARKLFVARINTIHEPSLRNRFNELLSQLDSATLASFIGDIDAFSKEVVAIRNYLTHFDRRAEKNKGLEKKQYEYVRVLVIVCTYLLLKRTRVDQKVITDGILRKFHYLSRTRGPSK